jgi:uncharacterized protein
MEDRKMNIIISIILTLLSFSMGFLAQRSRMCFIAGIRDFILVRDKELILGFITFLATIWLLTSILYGSGLINDGIPRNFSSDNLVAKSSEVSESESSRLEVESESLKYSKERLGYEIKNTLIGGDLIISPFFWASIIGGFILGLVSVRMGGCALRQHVLAAQGNGDALFYIMGFFSMVIIYNFVLRGFIDGLL